MSTDTAQYFERTELLLGQTALERLGRLRVIVFGVGGVGSWCAEALVRSGVGHISLVDSDTVAPSNINRQLIATSETIGRPKVDVAAERLRCINPDIDVRPVHGIYTADTAADFDLGTYDWVVDAIDSLADKALLICNATASSARLVSSMGAACKTDPTQIRIAEFWKVEGDPLARALRQRFRRSGTFPSRKFKCAYSPQQAPNVRPTEREATVNGAKRPNGTVVYVTAAFGLALASVIVTSTADT